MARAINTLAGKVTLTWQKVMAVYRWVDGLNSHGGLLPVHLDQPWAQRSETSTGKLYLFLSTLESVKIYSMAGPQHALTVRSEGKI